ncbi:MAG: ribonuclease PH [Candidatus Omnitrophica bacterium]|nr:ribonuclease PH [Candidatus Omnitrophota bacterium]
MRPDGRGAEALRKVKFTRRAMRYAEGSCVVEWGHTHVLCAASIEERVPPFLKGSGTGWVTAEYGMLPRATHTRSEREAARGKIGGRTAEIQRLIGRSLRAVTDVAALGERSIIIDCDVIQADGGTRCAAIAGGFIALVDALRHLKKSGLIPAIPLADFVAAVSVGVVGRTPVLDLAYEEDSKAQVDMNLVMTGGGKFVEIQGTAEHDPFATSDLEKLLALGRQGVKELIHLQQACLGVDSVEALATRTG